MACIALRNGPYRTPIRVISQAYAPFWAEQRGKSRPEFSISSLSEVLNPRTKSRTSYYIASRTKPRRPTLQRRNTSAHNGTGCRPRHTMFRLKKTLPSKEFPPTDSAKPTSTPWEKNEKRRKKKMGKHLFFFVNLAIFATSLKLYALQKNK